MKLGLVINFGERMVSAGIHRVVNGLPENIAFNPKAQWSKDGIDPSRRLQDP